MECNLALANPQHNLYVSGSGYMLGLAQQMINRGYTINKPCEILLPLMKIADRRKDGSIYMVNDQSTRFRACKAFARIFRIMRREPQRTREEAGEETFMCLELFFQNIKDLEDTNTKWIRLGLSELIAGCLDVTSENADILFAHQVKYYTELLKKVEEKREIALAEYEEIEGEIENEIKEGEENDR